MKTVGSYTDGGNRSEGENSIMNEIGLQTCFEGYCLGTCARSIDEFSNSFQIIILCGFVGRIMNLNVANSYSNGMIHKQSHNHKFSN